MKEGTKTMVLKVLIGLAVLVGVLAFVVSTRPATFHLERSIAIAAPPERAFAQVVDFHQWATWSPWEKLDPNMTRTYAGAPSGKGAVYSWSGSGKAGEGRMTIEEAAAPSKIGIKLEFIKPFVATNRATFTFAPTPTATGTQVTWAMDGELNFMSKAFHMVMDMDKLVGADFEKGLAAMKTNAERAASPQAASAGN
jgi:uncharacterized protein YndB with AHSA1/START domain